MSRKNRFTPGSLAGMAILTMLLMLLLPYTGSSQPNMVRDDTIPSPPGSPQNYISGPGTLCTGDTGVYSIDAPVGAFCEWTLNGVIQTADGCELEVVWNSPGLQLLVVTFNYTNGSSSVMDTLEVIVNDVPSQPAPISGDTAVCEYTVHTYYTTIGPYDSCEWKVNGETQPSQAPVMTYEFGGQGSYFIEVKAFNNCGISSPATLEVEAAGTAPDPPGPIQGPAESCEGYNETYTTTVNAGESCQWKVDGVIQPTPSTTLEVNWQERGWHVVEARAVTGCGTGNPTFLDVYVDFFPEVDLGNDTVITQGQSILLDAGNEGAQYLWNTGDTTRTINVSESGTYHVDVNTFCGNDSDEIEVTVFVYVDESALENFPGFVIREGLFILSDDHKAGAITVYDLSGRPVGEARDAGSIQIPRRGIFIIKIFKEGRIYTLKAASF